MASNAENVSIWWRHHVTQRHPCLNAESSLAISNYPIQLAIVTNVWKDAFRYTSFQYISTKSSVKSNEYTSRIRILQWASMCDIPGQCTGGRHTSQTWCLVLRGNYILQIPQEPGNFIVLIISSSNFISQQIYKAHISTKHDDVILPGAGCQGSAKLILLATKTLSRWCVMTHICVDELYHHHCSW